MRTASPAEDVEEEETTGCVSGAREPTLQLHFGVRLTDSEMYVHTKGRKKVQKGYEGRDSNPRPLVCETSVITN